MSYSNYEKAMELAPNCKFYTTVGGKSEDEINRSEKNLSIHFSKQCRDFYSKYGYMSFEGTEIFGIDPDDDSGILEGNSVSYALNDRKEFDLPLCWLPIYTYDDGYMAYLDYSTLNKEQEPRVIMAYYNGKEYVIDSVVSEDFGDFVLQLVSCQL